MSEKPMKWAVEAAFQVDPNTSVEQDAREIQRAAEPLLAVVRAAVQDDGEFVACRFCSQRVRLREHKFKHGPDCPVPAALKAMEVDGE